MFPAHKGSLRLVHNEHLDTYLTVAAAVEQGDHGYLDDWVSEEQKQKAIRTNQCWYLQWYPNGPIGFRILAAADLPVLMAAVAE